MKKNNHEYEPDLDILYIHNNPNNEKVKGTLPFGNLVFDVAASGTIIGAEIDCASKFFKLTPEKLAKLKTAALTTITNNNMLTLCISLETETKEHTFQIAIPRENAPLALTH